LARSPVAAIGCGDDPATRERRDKRSLSVAIERHLVFVDVEVDCTGNFLSAK
jgi:hypothetical protein